MTLLNKNECEKYVSSFIDMIDYRQSNKTFKHITRNNDYWKIVNYIMFLSRPKLSIQITRELKLEAAHMMCKIHYEWW